MFVGGDGEGQLEMRLEMRMEMDDQSRATALGRHYAGSGEPLQAFMWGHTVIRCAWEGHSGRKEVGYGTRLKAGGRQEAGAMAQVREDEHCEK